MTKPLADHPLAVAGAALVIIMALYFSFPDWIWGLLRKAYESDRLSLGQYLVIRDVVLYPADRIADRFPAYERWAFGATDRYDLQLLESRPIKDL